MRLGEVDPDHADVLLHSEESEKYRDLPFRSPASLEVFEYGREPAGRRRHQGPARHGHPRLDRQPVTPIA